MIDLKATKAGKENVTVSVGNEDPEDNVMGFVQKKVKKAPSFSEKEFLLDTGASNGQQWGTLMRN